MLEFTTTILHTTILPPPMDYVHRQQYYSTCPRHLSCTTPTSFDIFRTPPHVPHLSLTDFTMSVPCSALPNYFRATSLLPPQAFFTSKHGGLAAHWGRGGRYLELVQVSTYITILGLCFVKKLFTFSDDAGKPSICFHDNCFLCAMEFAGLGKPTASSRSGDNISRRPLFEED